MGAPFDRGPADPPESASAPPAPRLAPGLEAVFSAGAAERATGAADVGLPLAPRSARARRRLAGWDRRAPVGARRIRSGRRRRLVRRPRRGDFGRAWLRRPGDGEVASSAAEIAFVGEGGSPANGRCAGRRRCRRGVDGWADRVKRPFAGEPRPGRIGGRLRCGARRGDGDGVRRPRGCARRERGRAGLGLRRAARRRRRRGDRQRRGQGGAEERRIGHERRRLRTIPRRRIGRRLLPALRETASPSPRRLARSRAPPKRRDGPGAGGVACAGWAECASAAAHARARAQLRSWRPPFGCAGFAFGALERRLGQSDRLRRAARLVAFAGLSALRLDRSRARRRPQLSCDASNRGQEPGVGAVEFRGRDRLQVRARGVVSVGEETAGVEIEARAGFVDAVRRTRPSGLRPRPRMAASNRALTIAAFARVRRKSRRPSGGRLAAAPDSS